MNTTVHNVINGLSQSGLMSVDEVRSFQANLPSDARPADAESLVSQLIQYGKLTPYQANMIRTGQWDGMVLGEYVVLDAIGAGGMGRVMKARHRTMGREVAIKLLPPESIGSPDAVLRFQQEIRAVAKLSHPNIVTAYDAGQCGQFHYLVMEYVESRDLAAIVEQRGPLPVSEAVDYTVQAARGLLYAHGEGIVHRDIKPSNLLVDHDGIVRILDFGLAKLNEGPTDPITDETSGGPVTREGQVLGTYDFMSPDQAAHTHEADVRSDVYSLGCTLFSLLTGRRPYEGDGPLDKIVAHCMQPIPSARDFRSDVPEPLNDAIRKMMAKEAADRHQSMAEVIEALQAITADFSMGDCVASPSNRADLYAPTIATDTASTFRSANGERLNGEKLNGERLDGERLNSAKPSAWQRGRIVLTLILGVFGLGVLAGAGWLIWPREPNDPPGEPLGTATIADVAELEGFPEPEPGAQLDESEVPGERATSEPGVESLPLETAAEKPYEDPVDREKFGPFTDDLWDVSRGNIKIVDHSPLGGGDDTAFDIHALFGQVPAGMQDPLIFFERSAPGTVHWVEWEVPQAMILRSIFLKAGHEKETKDRAFRRFTLYATDSDTGEQVKVFEVEPAFPYATTSPPKFAAIKDNIHCNLDLRANVAPVKARRFRAEFEQVEGDEPTTWGPRVMELDGFDTFCPDIPRPPEPRKQ